MKFLVVLSIAVACVAGDAADFNAQVLKSASEINPEGAFQYAYETSNGISAQAQGGPKKVGTEDVALEVQGGWRYTAPDGTPVELSYVANEYGYQPSGPFIPTSPPVPEAIVRALEYIRTHPPQEAKGVASLLG